MNLTFASNFSTIPSYSTFTNAECFNWCSTIQLDSLFIERYAIIIGFIALLIYYALPLIQKIVEKELPEWLPDLCIQISFWGMVLYLILIALKLRGIISWSSLW